MENPKQREKAKYRTAILLLVVVVAIFILSLYKAH
jgi:hypothetical protein